MRKFLTKLANGIFFNSKEEPKEPTFGDIDLISEVYLATPRFCEWASPHDLCVDVSMISVKVKRNDNNQWNIEVESWATHKASLLGITEPSGIGGTAFADQIEVFSEALEELGYKKSDRKYPLYNKDTQNAAEMFKELQKLDFALTKDKHAVLMEPVHRDAMGLQLDGERTEEAQRLYNILKWEAKKLKNEGLEIK